MSRESTVILFGIALFFIPHLGIPEAWRAYFISGIGVLLLLVGYSLRRSAFHRRLEMSAEERGSDSFMESTVVVNQTAEAV